MNIESRMVAKRGQRRTYMVVLSAPYKRGGIPFGPKMFPGRSLVAVIPMDPVTAQWDSHAKKVICYEPRGDALVPSNGAREVKFMAILSRRLAKRRRSAMAKKKKA